jgi:F0F1-type ATP synthase membrane subunit a
MGFTSRGEIKTNLVDFYGTWTHIITGLSLLPVAFAFIYIEIKTHGFNYFFKYLSGDFSQVKKDISVMKQRQLPEANPNSIASIVQGLGLGALTLVLLSGCAWFVSWIYDAPWVKISKEIHQSLTGLIQAYVVAHGFMGLLHIYMASKK